MPTPPLSPTPEASPRKPAPSAGRSRQRPLQAAMLLSGAFFLSRVSGFIQLALIRALLPEDEVAAYAAAFTLPDVVNYIVAGGAMSVTFIPIFTQLREGEHPRAAWEFFSAIATVMGAALLLLVTLCVALAEPLTALFSPGLVDNPRTFALAVEMTRVMLPAQLFFYLGGMVIGVLNAHKRFGASGFTGVAYNLVAIFVGYCGWILLGAIGFAWGILIGAFVGNFVLPFAASKRGPRNERLQFRPSLDWRLPPVRRFFLNALPIMLGVSLPVVDQIVVKYFASGLGEAALSNLFTGNRFMLAPLGIVAQAASVAAFPYLASDSHSRDWKSFSEFLRNGLRRLMFLTLPLSVSLILIAQPVLSLFRFGQFSASDAQQSAVAFAFYCVGLFAWAGQQLAARGFYAMQDTRTPTIIGSLLALAFCGLCALMVRYNPGVAGLAFATSIGAAAQFVGVTLALDARLKQKRYNAPLQLTYVLGTLMRTGAACIPMGFAGLVADAVAWHLFQGNGKGGEAARLILVSIVAWATFLMAARCFQIPEYEWLRGKLSRRARRA